MIKSFADRRTQELYITGKTRRFPPDVAKRAARKLEYVNMSIPNSGEMLHRPTHPGEMLREDYLPDYGLTATTLAHAVGVSRQAINGLLRERRSVSPEMALRLARLFGNSPEFWLNAQRAVDLWEAAQAIQHDVARIQPLHVV